MATQRHFAGAKDRMARILGAVLAVLMSALLAQPAQSSTPKASQPAPHFEVTTLDGRHIDSDGLRGKVTLVHFWATWCPPCREEMPAIDKFYRRHRDEGFEVVAISVEDAGDEAKVRAFTKDFAFPVGLRGAADVDGFGRIWALPMSFLVDRRQVLRKSDWTGEEKIDAASLGKWVLPLLHEK
jgi:thiol-disulfide isomerase/thioredoxin